MALKIIAETLGWSQWFCACVRVGRCVSRWGPVRGGDYDSYLLPNTCYISKQNQLPTSSPLSYTLTHLNNVSVPSMLLKTAASKSPWISMMLNPTVISLSSFSWTFRHTRHSVSEHHFLLKTFSSFGFLDTTLPVSLYLRGLPSQSPV